MTSATHQRPKPAVLSAALAMHPDLNVASINGTVLAPIVTAAFERAATLPAASREALRAAARRDPSRTAVLKRALSAPGRRMILEVKAASPSEGVMRADVDVAGYASVYSRFADAISVLTEPRYFGGSFQRLSEIRQLTRLPILAKDFIISERQILAAANAGADAVLLMLSVLSDAGYRKLAETAHELGLEILTEADTQQDLERAKRLGAAIVGINNRNLRTLEVDRARAPKLADAADEAFILVGESGYGAMKHLILTEASGRISAFLCGSALSKSADLSQGVRELIYGRSKVCGITRVEDAVAAVKAGATSVGVIIASRSKRCVPLNAVQALVCDIRNATSKAGLMAEVVIVADASELAHAELDVICAAAPDVVQIHAAQGLLTPQYFKALANKLPGAVKLAPAVALAATATPKAQDEARELASALKALYKENLIDRVVLDHGAGGTGQTFDKTLLAAFVNVPRLVLAGGLCANNVRAAVLAAATAGVDLLGLDFNSGVETAPGVKSAEAVARAFAVLIGRQ